MEAIKIFDGAWHLPGALSLFEQKRLVKIYKAMQMDMYVPKVKSGNYMNLQMNCLGWHWNAVDYKYHQVRTEIDDQPVKPIHSELIRIAKQPSEQLFPYHNPSWDICLCNYYGPGSTLGLHKDNSESEKALAIGHPVVSFSVGASCIFRVGGLTRSAPSQDIRLKSGDIFIFGEESRLRLHGITKIFSNEARIPFGKSLGNGRINFTLRKL